MFYRKLQLNGPALELQPLDCGDAEFDDLATAATTMTAATNNDDIY